MATQQLIKTIVLASTNSGKCREIQQAFTAAALPFDIQLQSTLGIQEIEETENTFEGNALLKARHASKHTNLPALADDSGLVVDALGGAPGIYSARYAGVDSTDDEKMDKLLFELNQTPNASASRSAHYCCVLAYVHTHDDPNPLVIKAIWEGEILHEKRGNQGFGYDPIFYVPEYQCSAAELSPEVKNKMSHRGQALGVLLREMR